MIYLWEVFNLLYKTKYQSVDFHKKYESLAISLIFKTGKQETNCQLKMHSSVWKALKFHKNIAH